MKLVIDIPRDFEKHFNEDRFKDSLERIECDIQDDINKEHTIPAVSGLRELELIDMLIKAFEKAESVHSTCVLKGTPIYNDVPTKQGKWLINCDGYYPYCSNCKSEPPGRVMTDFCPICGADMRGKKK